MMLLRFFISLAVLSTMYYQVNAERCRPTKFKMIPVMKVLGLWRPIAYCNDGSRANPCCGNGKCNAVCRNCIGGCRKARTDEEEDGMKTLVTIASQQLGMSNEDIGNGGILIEDAVHPTLISNIDVISLATSDQQTQEQRYGGRPHAGGWGNVSLRPLIGGFGYPYGGGFGRLYGGRPWW